MTPAGYFSPPDLLLWSLYFLYKVRRELGYGWETDYVVFMYPSLLIEFFQSLRNLKLFFGGPDTFRQHSQFILLHDVVQSSPADDAGLRVRTQRPNWPICTCLW